MIIKDIMQTMDYGPAPEASTEARAWIAAHPVTPHYIGGRFLPPEGDTAEIGCAIGMKAADGRLVGKRSGELLRKAIDAERG